MELSPLIRPHIPANPTLDTAIWFLHLRWLAVIGQLATLAVVYWGFAIELRVWELLALIGLTATSNMPYSIWLKRLHRRGLQRSGRIPNDQVVTGLMIADIFILTGMLYLSAGIANPFALFYFVNIALASAIVTPRWAWIVWGVTVGNVILLIGTSLPIPELSMLGSSSSADLRGSGWTIPELGFLVAFTTCSGVITYFITVLTGELRHREKAVQDAKDTQIRNRQLEALATLAAGAGHELATPLSTIAVVAKELGRALDKHGVPQSVASDVALIRSELDRCRHILDRMTSAAGEAAGERLLPVDIAVFLDEALLGLREPDRVRTEIEQSANAISCLLPLQATAQALRNLIQNALDASPNSAEVLVHCQGKDQAWHIDVIDEGCGMPSEVVARIGEPFFTTKEAGHGMGLGVYLTQNVIRRLGGSLDYVSQPGSGTKATLVLPADRK